MRRRRRDACDGGRRNCGSKYATWSRKWETSDCVAGSSDRRPPPSSTTTAVRSSSGGASIRNRSGANACSSSVRTAASGPWSRGACSDPTRKCGRSSPLCITRGGPRRADTVGCPTRWVPRMGRARSDRRGAEGTMRMRASSTTRRSCRDTTSTNSESWRWNCSTRYKYGRSPRTSMR